MNKLFFVALACCALFINAIYIFQSDSSRVSSSFVGLKFIYGSPESTQNDSKSIIYDILAQKDSVNTTQLNSEESIQLNLTNPHPYRYLINPGDSVCSNQKVLLLAFVTIAVNNFDQRSIIRTTWSNSKMFPHIKTVFMVGTSKSAEVNQKVFFESQLYGDLVQEDFMDTYDNLTLKTIMGFKWASSHCKNAEFVMKVDDDVVVNSFFLPEFLQQLKTQEPELNNTIFGRFFPTSPVNRNPSSKFYTPFSSYKENS